MSHWVYILQSATTGRFYCGHTDNLERCITQHNDPNYTGSRTTKVLKGPWQVVWSAAVSSRSEAVILERRIKKRGIRRFVEDSDEDQPTYDPR